MDSNKLFPNSVLIQQSVKETILKLIGQALKRHILNLRVYMVEITIYYIACVIGNVLNDI